MSDTKLLQAILDKATSVDEKVDKVQGEVLENRKRIDRTCFKTRLMGSF